MEFLFLMLFTSSGHADVKQKAATCTACHGERGISPNPLWPNLAAQKPAYLEKQIKEFKDGTRIDPLMSPVSKMLSDDEVKELSEYFANLKGGP
jgi:cytochrome c553